MTTQILMPNSISDLLKAQTTAEQSSANSAADASNSSTNASSARKPAKLPYQASHQVELLHLQAETEALIQQLQTLKQQRVSLAD
jgi:hypothetical protein